MQIVEGFKTACQIFKNSNSVIYKAVRAENSRPVILKVLKDEYPSQRQISKFKYEYNLLCSMDTMVIAKAYGLQKHGNGLVMILEDFGGELLRSSMADHRFILDEFLRLSIQVAEVLDKIHSVNIIHKNINPSIFLWDYSTEQIKLIDLSLAITLPQEQPQLENPHTLEGELAYISPEQTGRMNRPLDYHTDLYSLGIVFYEILTGRVPFESTDALELVHSHIAKRPRPLAEINPDIPIILADIVMKLLEKNAEDRYQSAFGLKTDLECCLKQLKETGKMTFFELAREDFSSRFQIPHKLYGREQEVKALLQAFDRIGEGMTELMLVSGYSGIGKSSLVHEIHKPITEKRGCFISGKHEQYQRSIPYSALTQALSQFCRYLLTEPAEILQNWQTKIPNAVGNNGQVIIDVVPDLELIIGEQSSLSQVGPQESQNRFNMIFQKFIRAISAEEHPLVVFIDDLQWADAALLNLLKTLLIDKDINHLLIVGAYRDNEVDSTHPLIMTIGELSKENVFVNTVKLENLSRGAVNALIADTLDEESDEVEPLTGLIYEKTQGNAFFLTRFLQSLHEEDLVVPDHVKHKWLWDEAQIQSKQITDNVVDLMSSKIQKFSPETQSILKLASCIGSHFDLQILSIICQRNPSDTLTCLWTSIHEGLILPLDDNYQLVMIQDTKAINARFKFQHDRIRQAAYSLIDEGERSQIHLDIARLLHRYLDDDTGKEHLFDIVNQYEFCLDLLSDPRERADVRDLYIRASDKARQSAANASALKYIRIAMNLTGQNAWTGQYDVTLNVYRKRAEAEFINANYDESRKFIDEVVEHAVNLNDKADIYVLLLNQYNTLGQYKDAIDIGYKALSLLGIDLPVEDSDKKRVLKEELQRAEDNISMRSIESITKLPHMTDPRLRTMVRLLINLDPPAYTIGDLDLYMIISIKTVNVSLEANGILPETAKGLSNFGLITGSLLGNYELGYKYGITARDIAANLRSDAFICRTELLLGSWIQSWCRHINKAAVHNSNGIKAGRESGDQAFAGYNIYGYGNNLYMQGLKLSEVAKRINFHLPYAEKINNNLAIYSSLSILHTLEQLSGLKYPHAIYNTSSDIELMLSMAKNKNLGSMLSPHYIYQAYTHYLFGRRTDAHKSIKESGIWLSAIFAFTAYSEYYYVRSLIHYAIHNGQTDQDRNTDWQQECRESLDKFKKWNDSCPDNFQAKYLLLLAEDSRCHGGRAEGIIACYNQAQAAAKRSEFSHVEALIHERFAEFYLSLGSEIPAKAHLAESIRLYGDWGAMAKVAQLQEIHKNILRDQFQIRAQSSNAPDLDLATIMKAAQTISSEIVLEDLLISLMRTVIENAGAQRGYLILEKDGELVIEAEGSVDCMEVKVLQSIPLNQDLLPRSIINYVHRTGKSVVLDDAAMEDGFASDPYIRKAAPRSILCMPVMKQKHMVGILYLENNLSINAFTTDRIDVLEMLSSQVAISLENAMFFQELVQAKETLRENEKKFRSVIEQSNDAIYILFKDRFDLVNPRFTELTGITVEDAENPDFNLMNSVASEDRHLIEERAGMWERGEQPPSVYEFTLVHKNDMRYHVQASVAEIDYRDGKAILGILRDISEQKALENQLRQLLKMESVGTLAGGIAHDFNNLLTVINGRAEMILKTLEEDHPLYKNTVNILHAGEKAANLTKQLLAFSRKQITEPKIIDINILISDLDKMMRRLIGEDISMEIILVHDISLIKADPTQMEQVLINLIVNARDAINQRTDLASEKKITIETDLVYFDESYVSKHIGSQGGSHVMISVTDNGIGMNEETKSKIFEPFFTTKEMGQGTGLGLATVYGIVKQNKGDIYVYSEPEKGTTIKIYWHLTEEKKITDINEKTGKDTFTGYETILVVEDDMGVRNFTSEALKKFGYTVYEAPNGKKALELIKEKKIQMNLLLTDLVMPEMNGKELASKVKKMFPATEVLYTSGYTDNHIVHSGTLDEGINFIQKPFSIQALAKKVWEILDKD